jgi:hypothetical protein
MMSGDKERSVGEGEDSRAQHESSGRIWKRLPPTRLAA